VCCGVNPVGELDAGKPHVQFDERGAGDGVKDRIEAPVQSESCRTTATPRSYKLPRRSPTLQVVELVQA